MKNNYYKSLYIFLTLLLCFSFPLSGTSKDLNQNELATLGIAIPRIYTFKSADDGSSLEAANITGIQITLNTALNLGAALEYYKIKLNENGDNYIQNIMLDMIYTLDISLIKLGLGMGVGTSNILGDRVDLFESAVASQYFLRLGFPITSKVQVDFGLHNVFSRLKFKESDSRVEAGGTMQTIGVTVDF